MQSAQITAISVRASATIGEALAAIDRSARAALALVVGPEGLLINTITDGDVRRGMLAGYQLSDPLERLLEIKARMPHPVPVTAPAAMPDRDRLALMQSAGVRQLPLLNDRGRVVDLALLRDLLPEDLGSVEALLMAGGEGSRLRPLTDDVPKPMLPVAGRPVLEFMVEKLSRVGVRKVRIATHYKPETIVAHFGDGSAFGLDISYLSEATPLGTGGALGLLPRPNATVLVMNGDILSDVDLEAFYQYHRDQQAEMTVAVRKYDIQVPFGVVECRDLRVAGITEKPDIGLFVNAGIYLLEPSVFDLVPAERRLEMTELIAALAARNRHVAAYPVREYWLDIGRHSDYERAQADADGRRICAGVDA